MSALLPQLPRWCLALLLAALPWVAVVRPGWAPAVLAAAILVPRSHPVERGTEAAASLLVVASAWVTIAILGEGLAALGWLVFAVAVAVVGGTLGAAWSRRPDAADLVAVVGWGAAFVADPSLLSVERGGWLAPGLALWAAARVGRALGQPGDDAPRPAPPSREVRGTLSLRGVVVPDRRGVALTVPFDLELRAGDSVAILCDDAAQAAALGEVISGRRRPLAGELSVDGVTVTPDDRLVALAARGELFVTGDVERNLSVLCPEPVSPSTSSAVREACALDEVERETAGVELRADGAPLADFHRLLLLVARVMPSSYRVLVVVDPGPWVNAVRAELWRAAVVRASLGRTAIWLTADRDLARRAGSTLELRAGTLRAVRRDRTSSGEDG